MLGTFLHSKNASCVYWWVLHRQWRKWPIKPFCSSKACIYWNYEILHQENHSPSVPTIGSRRFAIFRTMSRLLPPPRASEVSRVSRAVDPYPRRELSKSIWRMLLLSKAVDPLRGLDPLGESSRYFRVY